MTNGLKKCSWPKKVLTVPESSGNTGRPCCAASPTFCNVGIYSISTWSPVYITTVL
jgi:hypothetical protein